MRHLGYWNQGITSGYGDLGLKRPGMQSIVAPFLWNDYPIVNDTPADKEGEEGALGGYNTNPSLYNSASRNNERIYADAGPLWTGGGWQVY